MDVYAQQMMSESRLDRCRATRRNAGFTLIEALICFVVFAIFFVALFSGLTWIVSTVQAARETVRATQIMEDKLDTVRLYSWNQITTPGFITNQFYESFSPAGALSSKSAGLTYTGRITIATAPLSESYNTNLLRITVDLDWPGATAVRHGQSSTFVSQYGMQGYIY